METLCQLITKGTLGSLSRELCSGCCGNYFQVTKRIELDACACEQCVCACISLGGAWERSVGVASPS